MVEAARLYRLTGDQKYAEWAAAQLDFYAEHYLEWPIQTAKSKSRLMHQSLDDANMLVRFIKTAHTLGSYPSQARRDKWGAQLFRPMALLLDETFQRVHNIGCWQRTAMAMAGLYMRDDQLWERAIDGPYGIRRQMEDGVTSDGLWLEQSLGYNSYVVSALLPLFEYAGLEGHLDEIRRPAEIAENLMLGPSALRFVDGKLPTPADSTSNRQKWPEPGILIAARRVFPTTAGLAAAAGLKNWDNLLDPPAAPTGPVVLPEVASRSLASSRMAVLRQGPWQIYFHYGQLDRSHAQSEALNFEAYYNTTDLTHDPGTVGYGSPLHSGYYQKGQAHNVPLIDGLGQAVWAPGELISFAPDSVAARQPEYRPGASAERRLSLRGGELVDEVRINTTDGKPHRLALSFLPQGAVEAPAGFEPDAAFNLAYWINARTAKPGAEAGFTISYAGLRMRLTVKASAPMKVTLANAPDAPPNRRDALYFEIDGTEATFTTTLRPLAAEAAALAAPAPDAHAEAQRRRIELNLLGAADTESGESRRNENVQFNLVDNNALKELNVRLGTTATIVNEYRGDRSYFGSEFGVVPPAPPRVEGKLNRDFHGLLRWSHLNSVTTARTFFQVGDVKPAHENDYGFRVSHAVWRGAVLQADAGRQQIRGQVNGNVLVPKADERTPLTADPEVLPIVQKFLGAYPKELPNRPDVNPRALNTNSPQRIDNTSAALRLDQDLRNAGVLAFNYIYSSQVVDAFQLVSGQNPDTTNKNHRARATWTRSWNPRLITDFTLGFDRLGSLLVPEPNAVGPMISTGGLETLGPQAIIPLDRAMNLYRTAGRLRRINGRHQWSLGFGVDRRQMNGAETDAHRGYFSFGNDFGRDSITNLRMGVPSQHIVSIGNIHRGFRNWEMQFYGEGQSRPTTNLTVQYSLRYQPVTVPYEVNSLNTIPYSSDLNNWAPSLGLAQRLPGNWGVLRAAGGVQFGEIFPVTYSQVRFSPPGSVKIVVPAPNLAHPLLTDPSKVKGNIYALDPELATPYSVQYNASWERELPARWRIQLGYVGSRSQKLLLMWYRNRAHPVPGIPQTTATINDRRPDHTIADFRWVLNGSRGYFDAGRATVLTPRWHRLSLEAAYWWSKAIDLGSAYTNTAYDADTRLSRAAYEYETRADMHGLSTFDQPHSFLCRGNYELPGRNHLWGGWNLSAVLLLKQGTPFTVVSGSDAPGYGNVDGNGNDRPILLDPSILGRTVGNPDTSRQLLPRSAFGFIQPTDARGNLGRSTFRKGGIRNLNASLQKTWTLDSARKIAFRLETINATNTPQFAEPGLELANGNFGQITNTLNEGRTFRGGVQFLW
ncbi:MAG: heparinase II/III family protein [Acidobacteria bacterium]|nr:heparinase II/III family protein [Acidobacteriota bacterium]